MFGIGLTGYCITNVIIAYIAGPYKRIIKGMDNLTDNVQGDIANKPTCGTSLGGCGQVGCGQFVLAPLATIFFMFTGNFFAWREILKIIKKK